MTNFFAFPSFLCSRSNSATLMLMISMTILFFFFMRLFFIFYWSLQQEHLSNAEDFYDDSLFDLVDMLEEVLPFFSLDFFGILHSIRICLSPYKLNPFLTFLLQERADLSSSASVSPPASINAVASSRGT